MPDEPDRQLLNRQGRCRACGSTNYTVRELTLHPDQNWRCYTCFEIARVFGLGQSPLFTIDRHAKGFPQC